MESDEFREPDLTRLDQGYRSQWELLRDLSLWIDRLLFYYYRYHRWLGPDSEVRNMLGLVVSREEFEHALSRAAQVGIMNRLSDAEREDTQRIRQVIGLRLHRTVEPLPLTSLFQRCGLDEFQRCCVVLAYLPIIDRKYEKLLAYLQDNMSATVPGTSLAVQLFLPKGGNVEQYLARLSCRDGFGVTGLFEAEALRQGRLELRGSVREYLGAGTIPERPGLKLFDGAVERPERRLVVQLEAAKQLDRVFAGAGACRILLCGPAGGGKRFQIRHLMSRARARCVFADLSGPDWEETAQDAALCARLSGAYLCLYHLDRRNEAGDLTPPDEAMMAVLERLDSGSDKQFFLSELPVRSGRNGLEAELELPPLTEAERAELFRIVLRDVEAEGDWTAEQLASTFRFGPRQVVRACEQAAGLARISGDGRVSRELLHSCCYRQIVHKLGDLASQVPAAYGWDDVVLPEAQKRLLKTACAHVLHQHQVYYRWGFEKKVSYGRGLSILFAGAPGTGKTMCAQVLARQLNMELYKINLSQIVSKYIGETEKNLRAVFSEAKNASCILFFDECDALFGKRSEVKDAHDRNANVEVAYLLQQIEEYDGVCVLATNLIGNIDAAFLRRITYVVHFPFPEPAMRERIYRRMLPASAPVDEDIDWTFLAEKFELSGGHIKNIVLAAAFMAAEENEPISMRHLLRSAVNEMRKNEIVVVREQLREYADLLED